MPTTTRRERGRQPRRLLRSQHQQPQHASEVRDGERLAARGRAGPPPADRARAQELKGLPTFRRTPGSSPTAKAGRSTPSASATRWAFTRIPIRIRPVCRARCCAPAAWCRHGHSRNGLGPPASIDYLRSHSGITGKFARRRSTATSSPAGQALGYKIGELKIKALRAQSAAALGDRFDLRRFHNALIDDGALPLDVLEQRIDAWILAEKGARMTIGHP